MSEFLDWQSPYLQAGEDVKSEVCQWEINYALENNKRLAPVMYRDCAAMLDKQGNFGRVDWSGLLRLACERLHHCPLLNAPETMEKGEEIVKIGQDAEAACNRRP
ncbi:hypothetical protein IQ266_24985 [filamentous cyanobacterium LEGE 11480]|uniref:Uncharacterized protein n=1 Tax=Romeriopsis navalis LEGE 11480 TaxID=2777977 RepID=A0A928VTX6_9CYAN|nr:hypothetical protein [Romeriopsis navalis]MBE9032996.1 hypothetical protein [Romeriopsis navalis LEGE 11480]